MKLIIEIPEDTKTRLCFGITYQKDIQTVCEALNNGTSLDKIRAELHATAEMHCDGGYYLRDEWVDEIFDKYKAESEENNG